MNVWLWALACAVFLGAAPAGAATWSTEEGSSVGFTAFQGGSPVEGHFESFVATIDFDPDDLASSRIEVVIDIASVNSESRDRDDTIRSEPLFNVATWPEGRFVADSFAALDEGRFEAKGQLTLRDVTKDVVLPFTLVISDHPEDPAAHQALALGELEIQRLDYGVGQGIWKDTSVVGAAVIIRIDILAKSPKP